MREVSRKQKVPIIGISEHARLTALATAASARMPAVADALLAGLETARVVAADRVPADAVRMGSVVECRDDSGSVKRMTLVYPEEADISQGRISVLTPLGAVLIGLAKGQSVGWESRDGRRLSVEIVDVVPASAELATGDAS